ncbi:MAG TPA: hypothetical protein V6C65_04670 [Allocoleopsis sp.]
MPAYTRGVQRDKLTYVRVNSALFYGFKTKDLAAVAGVSSTDLTTYLGHVSAQAVTASDLLCLGANAPKPPRVTKRIANAGATAQGSVSTFCAYDKIGAATNNGWTLSKPGSFVGLSSSGRTITAVVEITPNGVLYAFPMNAGDFQAYGAELGLKSAASITTESELRRLVRGASLPKPGRAAKALPGGSISSFYDPANLADLQQPTSGWRIQTAVRTLTGAGTTPTTP